MPPKQPPPFPRHRAQAHNIGRLPGSRPTQGSGNKKRRGSGYTDDAEAAGHPTTTTQCDNDNQHGMIERWNDAVHEAWTCRFNGQPLPTPSIPSSTWNEWLWRTNPTEPCSTKLLLNRSHILGLVLARCAHSLRTIRLR